MIKQIFTKIICVVSLIIISWIIYNFWKGMGNRLGFLEGTKISELETYQLRIKTKNAQIVCPLGHKLEVIKIPKSEIVLYCKKCKQFFPFPELNKFTNYEKSEKNK